MLSPRPESIGRFVAVISGDSGDTPLPTDYFRNFDASNAGSVYSDAYTTPAVADGSIYVIDDLAEPLSSKGAVQTSAGERPIWKPAIQNGLNVARFDGSNDNLEAGDVDGTTLNKLVVGLVIRPDAAPVGDHAYFSWTDTEGSGTNFVYIKDNGTQDGIDVYVDGGYQWTDIPIASCMVLVLYYDDDVGDWNLLVNGTAESAYTGGMIGQSSATKVWFFTGFHGVQKGDLGQAVFYGTPDSGTVAEKAEAVSDALIAKWGYGSSPPESFGALGETIGDSLGEYFG